MDSGLESEGEIKSENNQKKYFKQLWGASKAGQNTQRIR